MTCVFIFGPCNFRRTAGPTRRESRTQGEAPPPSRHQSLSSSFAQRPGGSYDYGDGEEEGGFFRTESDAGLQAPPLPPSRSTSQQVRELGGAAFHSAVMEEDLTPPPPPPGLAPQPQISRDLRVLQRKDAAPAPGLTLAGLMQQSNAIRTAADSRPSSSGRQRQQPVAQGGATGGAGGGSKENTAPEKAPKKRRLSLKKPSKKGQGEDDDDTGGPVAKRPTTAPGKGTEPVLPELTAEMFQGLET